MFFKNKQTDLVWEVIHPDHIKRCENDPNYEVVKEEKKTSNKRNANSKKEAGE